MKLNKAVDSEVKIKLALAACLILFAVIYRILPHPANFAPVAAIAIFGGAIFPRKLALTLPLLAMIASDLVIGLHSLVFLTWGSFALIAFLSNKFLKKIQPTAVVGASLGASLIFYLVSNFGVWLEGKLYPHTLEGLISCYYNALPFFRNTLMGDLVFTSALFGLYALCYGLISRRKNFFITSLN